MSAARQTASDSDQVSLSGDICARDLRNLPNRESVTSLNIEGARLTARIAAGMVGLTLLRELRLWCDISRTAMRHVLLLPELRRLDVLCLTAPGKLPSLEAMYPLEETRVAFGMTEPDLLALCECRSLRLISAPSVTLSLRSIDALLELPALESLDLEGSTLDDELLARLSASTTLRSLDLGSTRITREAITSLSNMSALRLLDLWATGIHVTDMVPLTQLPNLVELTLGDHDHQPMADADQLLELLHAMPALKRVWLDGVSLSKEQIAELAAHFEYVRINSDSPLTTP